MVIGPGMVILRPWVVWARASCASAACTRPFSVSSLNDARHHRGVAVVADSHRDLLREVDAVDELKEAMHEMLARLFAVGDDVDAGILLQLQDEQRRVGFCSREVIALIAPGRPEAVRLSEPEGLWERAGDGGRKEGHRPILALTRRICLERTSASFACVRATLSELTSAHRTAARSTPPRRRCRRLRRLRDNADP